MVRARKKGDRTRRGATAQSHQGIDQISKRSNTKVSTDTFVQFRMIPASVVMPLITREFVMKETTGINRRHFCGAAAITVAAGSLGLSALASQRSQSMNAAIEKVRSDKAAIRPFKVNVPEAELADMRRRIKATRLPEKGAGVAMTARSGASGKSRTDGYVSLVPIRL